MKYKIEINGKEYEIEQDVDGKFIKPDFVVSGGSALKPANEPICLARKPLSEKTIADNVLKHGTGGINIDGCRVGSEKITTNMKNTKGGLYNLDNKERTNEVENTEHEGRFPANIILDEEASRVLDEQSGESKSSKFLGVYGFRSNRNCSKIRRFQVLWYGDG